MTSCGGSNDNSSDPQTLNSTKTRSYSPHRGKVEPGNAEVTKPVKARTEDSTSHGSRTPQPRRQGQGQAAPSSTAAAQEGQSDSDGKHQSTDAGDRHRG